MTRKALIAVLTTMGIVAIAGTIAGLGLAGAFDSDETSKGVTGSPTPTPTRDAGVDRTFDAAQTPEPTGQGDEAPNVADETAGSNEPTEAPPAPDATSTRTRAGLAPGIEPDPDYKEALRSARFPIDEWTTDFSLHSVPYSEIESGGPRRDGIPPLDDPSFAGQHEADRWLDGAEPVIALEVNGEARAYPIQILVWHEIVNDVLGGVPVTVTFCPLCNSAIAFDRRLDGVEYDFGVSGNLRNNDMVMWDRQTQSWWQQFTGEGIVGDLTGRQLTILASTIISWSDFRSAHPDAAVLSRDTGYSRPYGSNPYSGYDDAAVPYFNIPSGLDVRLFPKDRVASFTLGDTAVAFPFSVLVEEPVVNYTVDGRDLVVFFKPDTLSPFGSSFSGQAAKVGSTGVFDSQVDGRKLTFRAEEDTFVDDETGSAWNILGKAVQGPLAGAELTPIVHGDHFWFAWAAFQPDTLIYGGKT